MGFQTEVHRGEKGEETANQSDDFIFIYFMVILFAKVTGKRFLVFVYDPKHNFHRLTLNLHSLKVEKRLKWW